MMGDLTGQAFGRLTVLSRAMLPDKNHGSYWLCRCECGQEKTIRGYDLTKGLSQSCGCRRGGFTHGVSQTPIYDTWLAMRQRCSNPNHPRFQYYGARGIKICKQWQVFEVFLEDMGPTWAPGLSIERLDVNGHYEPGNCIWIPLGEQWKNRRTDGFERAG